jgi:hypothetical protein
MLRDDSMKKRFIILSFITVMLVVVISAFVAKTNQKSTVVQLTNNCDTRDTVIETLLSSEIQKDVDAYYKPYFNTQLNTSPVSMSVLGIERAPSGYDVTLQVLPYLGAHNAVGEDKITINVTTDSIRTKEFKHVRSSNVPEWLKQYVIKWPPEG